MSEYKVSSDPCFLVFTLAPYVYYMETSHFICNGTKYGQILTRKKKSDLDTFYAVNHISLSRWCDDKNRVEYFWKRNLWFNL